jgi:hypothetical protein
MIVYSLIAHGLIDFRHRISRTNEKLYGREQGHNLGMSLCSHRHGLYVSWIKVNAFGLKRITSAQRQW